MTGTKLYVYALGAKVYFHGELVTARAINVILASEKMMEAQLQVLLSSVSLN